MKVGMTKYQAEKLCIKLNDEAKEWRKTRAQRTPNFMEWRQGLPEECITPHFKKFFSRLQVVGIELKNAFSLYSKLIIAAPEFVNKYIEEGQLIERPMKTEWNIRKLIEQTYGISEGIYRIIEQEKMPDSRGTTRSGFEALQAMFIKGCKLGDASTHADYTINGIKFENKGESGRCCGQDDLFSADGYQNALDWVAGRWHCKTFDAALRKSFHAGKNYLYNDIVAIMRGIYSGLTDAECRECVNVYMKCLATIPETTEVEIYKKVCVRRQSKYYDAEYEVRPVVKCKPVNTGDREKEVLRFVAGIMELKMYQRVAQFDILDLCENKTGRILSFDCNNMTITDMAQKMWGRVRFSNGIRPDSRAKAHQIGFVY